MAKLYKRMIIMVLLGVFIINSATVTYGLSDTDVQRDVNGLADIAINEFKLRAEIHPHKAVDELEDEINQKVEEIIGQVNCDLTFETICYKGDTTLIAELSGKGELDYEKIIEVQKNFKKNLSQMNVDAEYSLCVKSKILNNTMEEIKEGIIDYLTVNKAQNTEVTMINNGYSIMSTLGMENKKVVLGKNIDFSCAIVKYSSGCYLLLGTPEITITY